MILSEDKEDTAMGPIRIAPLPMPIPSPPAWRRVPLTLGLVIAIIVGVAWFVDVLHGHDETLRVERVRLMSQHNRDDQAHPGIRRQLGDMERRMTKRVEGVAKDVKGLRDDVRRALDFKASRGMRHR